MAAFPPTGFFLGGGFRGSDLSLRRHTCHVPQTAESTGDLALSSAFTTRLWVTEALS
jgi:hypothetical protein